MLEYRVLTADEMPGAVSFWVSVFGVEPEFFQSLLEGSDDDQVSLGAFADGQLASSVHVFIRWFRNREGQPLKVGGIGSVSTDPNHRSQGYSARLLDMAIEEMEARGCVWSYLGTGVNRHYARHGWRTVSTASVRARLASGANQNPVAPETVTPALLEEMAALHACSTSTQPMANARSNRMWQHAVRYRVSRPEDRVFTLREGTDLAAYLVTREESDGLTLVEAAGDSVAELMRQVLAGSDREGHKGVTAALPYESQAMQALRETCEASWPQEDTFWMARPIAGRISWPDLAAILADPCGRRSDLDNF